MGATTTAQARGTTNDVRDVRRMHGMSEAGIDRESGIMRTHIGKGAGRRDNECYPTREVRGWEYRV